MLSSWLAACRGVVRPWAVGRPLAVSSTADSNPPLRRHLQGSATRPARRSIVAYRAKSLQKLHGQALLCVRGGVTLGVGSLGGG